MSLRRNAFLQQDLIFKPVELSYSNPIIDIHTHPVFMGNGRLRSEVKRLVTRARRFGIERMVALGDVLVYGPSPNGKKNPSDQR